MVEHALEEGRVPLGGHPLEGGSREVAVVVAHKDGHAARDGGVDLVGRLTPLLHRVVKEDVLKDVVGDLHELGVVLLAKLHDRHLLVLSEGGNELLVEALALLLAKGELEGAVVERDRHERAVDVRKDLVLVVGPLGEAREELVHALVHGVVDVWAVLVDEDSGIVNVVVGVAGDVVATLEDADLEPAGLGQAARADGTSVARADNDGVIGVGRETIWQTVHDTHRNPLSVRQRRSQGRCGQRARPIFRTILAPRPYNDCWRTRGPSEGHKTAPGSGAPSKEEHRARS